MATTVYKKSAMLTDKPMHYCPGCAHGLVHKLVAEATEELGLMDNLIGVASVGCSVFSYDYFNCDMEQAAHGRAPAVATGIKRVHPDKAVFTYQGDGDLASIGMAEIVHAATRGENITVIFINNAIYGMTGGQIAPTTLMDQKATTAPTGRKAVNSGYPINMAETLATLQGVCYSERVTVTTPQNVMKAKKAIKKAFDLQMAGKGMTFVEVLSPCPTNWGMQPIKAMEWINEVMVEQYPLGVFKDEEDEAV